MRACHNRLAAVNHELHFEDRERKREYRIAPGELPFFMHRERGLHLDEPEVTVDGKPVSAAILGTALTLFYPGRAQAGRGQGIYFYLPKVDGAEECAWYRDLFDASRAHLPFLKDATIRAIPLVEALPAVYEMEEMLHALGPYAAGLNAARWDLKASIFEFVMADPEGGVAGSLRRRHEDHSVHRQHLPPAGGGVPEARGGADRRHGHRAAEPGSGGEPGRRGVHPRGQGVGGGAGLHPRVGGPHLPHEDGGRALQARARRRDVEAHRPR